MRLEGSQHDNVANKVFWHGWAGYEPETAPLWRELCQQAEVVLDVGAQVGYFALLAGLAGKRVVAFEPAAANAERCRANIARNGLRNVELVEAAVADHVGVAEFTAPADRLSMEGQLVSGPAHVDGMWCRFPW